MSLARVEIPVKPLHARLSRHAAQIGAIASAGEWSLPVFRQCVAPVLVALARRIDGLPSPERHEPDAGVGGLIARALLACRSGRMPSSGDREQAAARQVRELAAALAVECARIRAHWMAVDTLGRRLDTGAEPLSARALRLGLSRYFAVPAAAVVPAEEADVAVSALAWLLRDLPAVPLATLLGEPADELPRLLRQVRDPRLVPSPPRGPEADAMDDLVREGRWQVNRRKGRLWWLERRLYLAWRTGARELSGRCRSPEYETAGSDGLLARLHQCGLARDRVQVISTPWSPALDAVELCDPLHWLALAACANPVTDAQDPARNPRP